MNMNKKEDLIEQYEDAALALMMSEYAEQEGNRLLQEFEEAKARGDVPAVPAELDEKCRNLIHKAYKKERTRKRLTHLLCFAGKTAAAWFVVIGLCTTLIVSVDALRIPVSNFILEQHEKYTSFTLSPDPYDSAPPSKTAYPLIPSIRTPLDGLLPDGYSVRRFQIHDGGLFVSQYKDSFGNIIALASSPSGGRLNVDTENGTVHPVTIAGFNGYFIDKGSKLTILWHDSERDLVYTLWATKLSRSELWTIAENFIAESKGGS